MLAFSFSIMLFCCFCKVEGSLMDNTKIMCEHSICVQFLTNITDQQSFNIHPHLSLVYTHDLERNDGLVQEI